MIFAGTAPLRGAHFMIMRRHGWRSPSHEPLGILMLDTRFPRIVGDIGNAGSRSTSR